MKSRSRLLLLSAAFVLMACTAIASNGAPGLEVVAKIGRTVVFQGLTDGTGRFTTGPLEPGIYTFEVRVPKTIITPARYFLALSGAKPVSEPMMGPGLALSMNAQVRSARQVRGQVTGRRVIIVPAQPASASSASVANPTASSTAISAANRGSAVSAAAPGRGPAPASGAITSATAVVRPETTTSSTAAAPGVPAPQGLTERPSSYQPRIINGRVHVWQAIAPGSTLGRWVPKTVQRTPAAMRATPAPAPAQPLPRSTPTAPVRR